MTADRTVGNVQLMQKINRLKVLNLIRQCGTISRPEICKKTGLSASSVTNIITYFMQRNLVMELGSVDSKEVGRKAVLIKFNAEAYYIIAIDIDVDRIIISLTNLAGELKKMKKTLLSPVLKDYEVLDLIGREIGGFIESSSGGGEIPRIMGIGIAVSGPVKNSDRLILSSSMKWKGMSLKEYFESIFKLPVIIENSSRTKALYELRKANNIVEKNLIFLDLTMGIGIVNFYENKINEAVIGEFGHTTVKEDGPLCFCGNRGCLELMCSVKTILSRTEELLGQGKCSVLREILKRRNAPLDYERILEASEQGDPDILGVIRENGEYLGIGIANIINIFNPQKIIINGDLLLKSDYLFKTAIEIAKERAYEDFIRDLKIEKVNISIEDAIKGISMNVADRLFELSDDFI